MLAYVINLDHATDRWSRVEETLVAAGMQYQRVSAVYGKHLTLPHPDFAGWKYRLYHGKRPNLGQIGCFLSHLEVYRRFLASDAEYAMVCEDDILVAEDIRAVLDAAVQHSELWDILRCSGFHDPHPLKVTPLVGTYQLAVSMTRLCGTGCYVVNRKAAAALLQKMAPMRLPIDHSLDREWMYGLRAAMIDPLPVQQNLAVFQSSLPAGNDKLPGWQRYWSVFPFRAVNEARRLVSRSRQYLDCRRRSSTSDRRPSSSPPQTASKAA